MNLDFTFSPLFGNVSGNKSSSRSRIQVKQFDQSDCGIACLQSLHRFYGKEASITEIRALTGTDPSGTSVYDLVEAARLLGYKARGLKLNAHHLGRLKVPFIARIIPSQGPHFVVVYQVNRWLVKVMDPAIGKYCWIPRSRFARYWSEVAVSFNPLEELQSKRGKLKQNPSSITALDVFGEGPFRQGQGLLAFVVLMFVGAPLLYSQLLIDQYNINELTFFIALLFADIARLVFLQAKRSRIKKKKVLLLKKLIKAMARLPKSLRKGYSEGEYFSRMNDVFQLVGFVERLFLDLPWSLFLWFGLTLLLNHWGTQLLFLSLLISLILLQLAGIRRLLTQSGQTSEHGCLRKSVYRLFYSSELLPAEFFNQWKDFLKVTNQVDKNLQYASNIKTVYSILFLQIILLSLSLFCLSYFFQNLTLEPAAFLLMFFHFTKTQFLVQFLLEFKQFRISRNRLNEVLNFKGLIVGK